MNIIEYILNLFIQKELPKDSQNGVKGLEYLEQNTKLILKPKRLKKFEWRRKIISSTGDDKFKIIYFGDLHEELNTVISNKGSKPFKVFAIDSNTEEKILIFDLGLYGYSSMFAYEYSKEELSNRNTDKIYKLNDGRTEFELFISAYYNFNFDEYKEYVDQDGKVELINGEKINWETAKRNACGYVNLWTYDLKGNKIDIILCEELD